MKAVEAFSGPCYCRRLRICSEVELSSQTVSNLHRCQPPLPLTEAENTMLCQLCKTISLELRPDTRNGSGEQAKTLIRMYANIYTLRDSAHLCDFCGLVYEEAQSLETDQRGPYCKQRWGKELTDLLLDQSPVCVYHTGQNIKIKSLLDAQHAPTYAGGPIAYEYNANLGGLCVSSGKASWPVNL